jgi:hypothetical protein
MNSKITARFRPTVWSPTPAPQQVLIDELLLEVLYFLRRLSFRGVPSGRTSAKHHGTPPPALPRS